MEALTGGTAVAGEVAEQARTREREAPGMGLEQQAELRLPGAGSLRPPDALSLLQVCPLVMELMVTYVLCCTHGQTCDVTLAPPVS